LSGGIRITMVSRKCEHAEKNRSNYVEIAEIRSYSH